MNLPNFLVVIRVVYIPVILFCAWFNSWWSNLVALLLVSCSIVLDFIDGRLARRANSVSKFGSYWDQLSDKLLINTLFVVFLSLGLFPLWMIVLNVVREFIVHEVRLVAKSKDLILASEKSGKFKAACQMGTLFSALVLNLLDSFDVAPVLVDYKLQILFAMMLLTLFVAYYALVEFFVKNRDFIRSIP